MAVEPRFTRKLQMTGRTHLFGESSDTKNSGSVNTYYSYVVRADGSLAQAVTAQPMPDPSVTTATVAPNYLGWLAMDRTGSTLYGYELTLQRNLFLGLDAREQPKISNRHSSSHRGRY